MAKPKRTIEERFWTKVAKRGPDECWLWTAGRDRHGYGHFDSHSAHRTAWSLTNGAIPPGLFVCHRCDNRPCCNPSHLFTGTAKDNNRDMMEKGRYRPGGLSRPGEKNPMARLTEIQALEIIKIGADMTSREVGKRYGITGVYVREIRCGKRWAHLKRP